MSSVLTPRSSEITICITAFNEAANIPALFRSLDEINDQVPVSIVLVDNGSHDDTRDVAEHERTRAHVQVVRLDVNRRYGGGMAHAIRSAATDVVCMIPADNQYRAVDVITCLRRYQSASGLADGQPLMVKGHRALRHDPLGIKAMSFVYSTSARVILWLPRLDINGLPKVFDRRLVLDDLDDLPTDAVFDASILAAARHRGCRIEEVPVEFVSRSAGHNSWTGRRLRVASKMMWTLVTHACKVHVRRVRPNSTRQAVPG